MSRERLNPELAGVEAALAGLRPAPSALDRDRLMFLAGQAAGRRRARLASWWWPCTSAAATIAACVLGGLLLARAGPDGNRQAALTPAPQPSQAELPLSPWTAGHFRLPEPLEPRDADRRYLELRQLVLTRGVEALPELTPSAATEHPTSMRPSTHGRMLEQWLDG